VFASGNAGIASVDTGLIIVIHEVGLGKKPSNLAPFAWRHLVF